MSFIQHIFGPCILDETQGHKQDRAQELAYLLAQQKGCQNGISLEYALILYLHSISHSYVGTKHGSDQTR